MGSLSLSCKNAGCGLDQGSIGWSYLCPRVLILFKPHSNHGLFPGVEPLQLPILIMQDIWRKERGEKVLIVVCPKLT